MLPAKSQLKSTTHAKRSVRGKQVISSKSPNCEFQQLKQSTETEHDHGQGIRNLIEATKFELPQIAEAETNPPEIKLLEEPSRLSCSSRSSCHTNSKQSQKTCNTRSDYSQKNLADRNSEKKDVIQCSAFPMIPNEETPSSDKADFIPFIPDKGDCPGLQIAQPKPPLPEAARCLSKHPNYTDERTSSLTMLSNQDNCREVESSALPQAAAAAPEEISISVHKVSGKGKGEGRGGGVVVEGDKLSVGGRGILDCCSDGSLYRHTLTLSSIGKTIELYCGQEGDGCREVEGEAGGLQRLSKKQHLQNILQSFERAGLEKSGNNFIVQNCAKCGTVLFNKKQNQVSHGANQNTKVPCLPPSLLLECLYEDQYSYYANSTESSLKIIESQQVSKHRVALAYVKQRDEIVERILSLGARFKQRQRTKYFAIEFLDHFFLNERAQIESVYRQLKDPRSLNLVMTTCFILASKFDEIDDQLVFIKDIQSYYRSIDLDSRLYRDSNNSNEPLPRGRRFSAIPTYTEIVDCERHLLQFFDWNLSFVLCSTLPFLESYLSHTQSTCFASTANSSTLNASSLPRLALKSLDSLFSRRLPFRYLSGWTASTLAALALYRAREEELSGAARRRRRMGGGEDQEGAEGEVWTDELQIMTLISREHMELLIKEYNDGLKMQREVISMEYQGSEPDWTAKDEIILNQNQSNVNTNLQEEANSRNQLTNNWSRTLHTQQATLTVCNNETDNQDEIRKALEMAKTNTFRVKKKVASVVKIEVMPQPQRKRQIETIAIDPKIKGTDLVSSKKREHNFRTSNEHKSDSKPTLHPPSFSSLTLAAQVTDPLPNVRPSHTSIAFYDSGNNHGSSLCNIRKYMPIERGTSNSRPQSSNKKQRPSASLNKLNNNVVHNFGGSRAFGQEYSDSKLGKGSLNKGSTIFTQRVPDLNGPLNQTTKIKTQAQTNQEHNSLTQRKFQIKNQSQNYPTSVTKFPKSKLGSPTAAECQASSKKAINFANSNQKKQAQRVTISKEIKNQKNIMNDKKATVIFADRRQTMSCADITLTNNNQNNRNRMANTSGSVPGDKRHKQRMFNGKGQNGVAPTAMIGSSGQGSHTQVMSATKQPINGTTHISSKGPSFSGVVTVTSSINCQEGSSQPLSARASQHQGNGNQMTHQQATSGTQNFKAKSDEKNLKQNKHQFTKMFQQKKSSLAVKCKNFQDNQRKTSREAKLDGGCSLVNKNTDSLHSSIPTAMYSQHQIPQNLRNIQDRQESRRQQQIQKHRSSEGHSASQTTANGEHSSKFTGCSSTHDQGENQQLQSQVGFNAQNLLKSYRKEILRVTQTFKTQSSLTQIKQHNASLDASYQKHSNILASNAIGGGASIQNLKGTEGNIGHVGSHQKSYQSCSGFNNNKFEYNSRQMKQQQFSKQNMSMNSKAVIKRIELQRVDSSSEGSFHQPQNQRHSKTFLQTHQEFKALNNSINQSAPGSKQQSFGTIQYYSGNGQCLREGGLIKSTSSSTLFPVMAQSQGVTQSTIQANASNQKRTALPSQRPVVSLPSALTAPVSSNSTILFSSGAPSKGQSKSRGAAGSSNFQRTSSKQASKFNRQPSRTQQKTKHQLVCSQTYKDLSRPGVQSSQIPNSSSLQQICAVDPLPSSSSKPSITRTRTQNHLNNSVSSGNHLHQHGQPLNLKRQTTRKGNPSGLPAASVFELQEPVQQTTTNDQLGQNTLSNSMMIVNNESTFDAKNDKNTFQDNGEGKQESNCHFTRLPQLSQSDSSHEI